jgi:hypothetical protein
MKKSVALSMVLLLLFLKPGVSQESKSSFNVTADLMSNYVWRGIHLGKGPAIQPSIEFSSGGFTLGTWGSVCLSDKEAAETDLYTSFSFGPGISLGVTDYYFLGPTLFDINNNAIEVNGSFSPGNFSLSANYILNDGAGAAGGDFYTEVGVKAGKINLFAGAGNGWHTFSGKFEVCNVGLSIVKEIKITDNYSVPVTGSAILNPSSGQIYVVAGITL